MDWGRHPLEKTKSQIAEYTNLQAKRITAKGETPIEKNIFVVDEQGNEYEATYPKRAKGLVKNGRARFLNENTICLACPPDISEDKNMSENKNCTINETLPQEKLSMSYILKQIEAIQSQTDYLQNVIASLTETHSGGPGDIGAQERARALGEIVVSRETTNQRLIAFYEKLYDDLKPGKAEAVVNLLLDTMDDSRLPEGMRECVEQHLHNVLSELSMNLSR